MASALSKPTRVNVWSSAQEHAKTRFVSGKLTEMVGLCHPLHTHCEPSAPYCWILEILFCTPKGRRALLRIPTTGRAKCLSMLGEIKT